MTETRSKANRWLALESPNSGGHWGCRIESVGVKLPGKPSTPGSRWMPLLDSPPRAGSAPGTGGGAASQERRWLQGREGVHEAERQWLRRALHRCG
jgi:hypothetical protein